MGGGDIIEAVVFDFLMDSNQTSLSEVSSQIDQRLRSSVQRDRFRSGDSDNDEHFGMAFIEDEFREEFSGTPRELPVRQWIYNQTERLSEHAGRFGRLLQQFIAKARPYPAAKLGEDVCPIDIDHRRYRNYRAASVDTAPTNLEKSGPAVILAPPDEAASHFAEGYASYVRALASAAQEMPTSYPSHLHYTVRSTRRGFRVHSTPLYWMSPTVFGGKKTSPVSGYLAPGLYRFGGDRPNNLDGITWDSGQHAVSPTSKSTSVTSF